MVTCPSSRVYCFFGKESLAFLPEFSSLLLLREGIARFPSRVLRFTASSGRNHPLSFPSSQVYSFFGKESPAFLPEFSGLQLLREGITRFPSRVLRFTASSGRNHPLSFPSSQVYSFFGKESPAFLPEFSGLQLLREGITRFPSRVLRFTASSGRNHPLSFPSSQVYSFFGKESPAFLPEFSGLQLLREGITRFPSRVLRFTASSGRNHPLSFPSSQVYSFFGKESPAFLPEFSGLQLLREGITRFPSRVLRFTASSGRNHPLSFPSSQVYSFFGKESPAFLPEFSGLQLLREGITRFPARVLRFTASSGRNRSLSFPSSQVYSFFGKESLAFLPEFSGFPILPEENYRIRK
ncbi:hypothetical protein [Siminovitchia fortis]|uniref:Uncharacterized protein n=1 Tax=Siminovitchia fortis TaxID=254758 RepID=A0A443J0T4_9BACI|nr:hypothetical protein [Siminovitchia fortis]RWR13982.1 hypothetical protein D4N35_003525 [Siminovitchia fortis]